MPVGRFKWLTDFVMDVNTWLLSVYTSGGLCERWLRRGVVVLLLLISGWVVVLLLLISDTPLSSV
jgi:hypothetical protein